MCGSESDVIFNWVGAIVVNLAFFSIVSSSGSLVFSLIACILYIPILFSLGNYYERKAEENRPQGVSEEGLTNHRHRTVPTIVGLYHGLAIIALGATGMLLAINIFADNCQDDGDDWENYQNCQLELTRKQATACIFFTAIPIIVVSIVLWMKKSTPACGFTTYLGIGLLGVFLWVSINPDDTSSIKWWFFSTSTIWTLCLAFLFLTHDAAAKGPITWGINTGAIVYFSSMFGVVDPFGYDTPLRWVLINIFSFVPLTLLGVVTDHNFLVFLGSLVLLIDAWRFAMLFHINYIFQFGVLAIAGFGTWALGWWITKEQDTIRDPCVAWVRSHSRFVRHGESMTPFVQSESIPLEQEEQSIDSVNSAACCGDPKVIFNWMGALILNIAVIVIIGVSSSTSFTTGFIICFLYTLLLFSLAHHFEKNGNGIEVSSTVGLLYGIGIMALGASGFLFSLATFAPPDTYATGSMLFTAIPITIASIYLWVKKSVSPCGFTTFFGFSLLGFALHMLIWPDGFSNTFFKLWFTTTSVVYSLFMGYLLVANQTVARGPLPWGLYTGALTFFITMFGVMEVYNDTFLNWFLVNVFSFLPLILLGVIIDRSFVVFLGALGLMIDAYRLGSLFSSSLGMIVLVCAGIGLMTLGPLLKEHEHVIRDPCIAWLKGPASTSIALDQLDSPIADEAASSEVGDKTYGSLS